MCRMKISLRRFDSFISVWKTSSPPMDSQLPASNGSSQIKYVFVLMLENRSFDHLLGFSGIKNDTKEINGLTGKESNSYQGQAYTVQDGADQNMPLDPGHDFLDVVTQLGGESANWNPLNPKYPPINNSGFVANYAVQKGKPTSDLPEIMKCFDKTQIPVLYGLATNYAVCDNYFASMPGPTWPNRYFVHAASSAGLDHAPTDLELAKLIICGMKFENGSIYDKLNDAKIKYRIYRGDVGPISGGYPMAASIEGVHLLQMKNFSDFDAHINDASGYSPQYTFIEPNYGCVIDGTYKNGTSQHPMDSVSNGEQLINSVYTSLRRSNLWNESLLIINYDEHGGFYDHVSPQEPCVPPGDKLLVPEYNHYGFAFNQYGVRLPAVLVSPLIPKNTIDSTFYDHTSVLATVEQIFNLTPMTARDRSANNFTKTISLSTPRPSDDCPLSFLVNPSVAIQYDFSIDHPKVFEPVSLSDANMKGILMIAVKSECELLGIDDPEIRKQKLEMVLNMNRKDAHLYMKEILRQVQVRNSGKPQIKDLEES